MAEKVIFAMYDDDDKLMDGAKHLVANDVKVSSYNGSLLYNSPLYAMPLLPPLYYL